MRINQIWAELYFDADSLRLPDGSLATPTDIAEGRVSYDVGRDGEPRLRQWKARKPKHTLLPKCGAKTRLGVPCQAKVCVRSDGTLTRRCRLHGGLSTGPKTAEGRAAIGAANKGRAK